MSWRDRPALAGFALYLAVALLPLAASLVYGGLYSLGIAGLLAPGATLAYWSRTLSSPELWSALAYSVYIAAAVVGLAVALALTLALLLRDRLGAGWLSGVLLLPMALPGAVAGFVIFQTLTAAGVVGRWVAAAGLPALTNDRPGLGIILAHLLTAVPFFTLLFAQVADSERLTEFTALARTLGAGRVQRLRRVALPLMLRGASSSIWLVFVVVMGSYEIPLLLGRQTPEMISVLALRKYAMYDLTQKPEAFVVAILYTLVTAGLVTLVMAPGDRKGGRAA